MWCRNSDLASCVRQRTDGIEIAVRLTPRASKDAIEGESGGEDDRRLAARVRAVPEKGAANAALEKLVAASLGVPKSAVSVVAGASARLKTVRVLGVPDRLAAALDDAIGKAGGESCARKS